MSTMYIAEFDRLTHDVNGHPLQVGQCPPIAQQTVTFTGTHGASAAFNASTRFVRIVCDAIAHLEFASTPVSTTSKTIKVEADTPEYFGVNGGDKVSAIAGV